LPGEPKGSHYFHSFRDGLRRVTALLRFATTLSRQIILGQQFSLLKGKGHLVKRTALALFLASLVATIVSLRATGASGTGSISISDGTPILQDFNALSTSVTPSTALPNGWYLTEIGASAPPADGAYVGGTGSSNAGNAYSFGASGDTDRALGSLGSGSVTMIHYGAKFTNVGTGPITTLAISYDGEMWRRGTAVVDGLAFSYSTNATDLTTGTFTPIQGLNFTSPGSACSATTNTATNGNTSACRTSVSGTITGILVNPGATIFIRWTDVDTAGSDDGVAIDNVSVSATFSTDPTPPVATASATPNPVNPGQTITLAGTILTGFNPLSQRYTVSCDLSAIGGLNDEVLLSDSPNTSFNVLKTVASKPPLGSSQLPCSVVDDLERSSTFTIAITVLMPLSDACGADATPVSAIQGAGTLSPLTGQIVDVEAVVVADFQAAGGLSGFYVEAPDSEQDGNPATSEGVFVFSPLPASVADRVRVRATVAEFQSATGSLVSHLTELGTVTSVQVCSSGQTLPSPADVSLPVTSVSQWERYEGMLVRFNQQLVVTGNFSLGRFGQIDLAPEVLYQPTQQVGTAVTWGNAADLVARSLIALDDASTQADGGINGGTVAPYPPPGLSNANTLRVGALVNANGDNPPTPLVGILDDRFGAYRIQPVSSVTFSNAPNPRPDTAAIAAAVGARFRIVSANVLNFFVTLGSRGAATQTELDHQRAKIVAELANAGGDVIGLSELQNFQNGSTNGGTYTNDAIGNLTSALAAATGRDYRYVNTIDPLALAAGNVPTDNGTDAIRSGFIYDVGTVARVGFPALLSRNDQNRPTIAQTFQPVSGLHPEEQTFTVVVNHFRSKGSACGTGDDPLQGNCNGMRLAMANSVLSWLDTNPTSDPAGTNRRYVVIGDFNAYFGEDPIQAFVSNAPFTDTIDRLLGDGAYSFNFGSQSGYLDHALVNPAALPLVKAVAELHVNADEPAALQALDTNLKSATAQTAYFGPNEFAASDHDPIVIGFNPLRGDFDDDGKVSVSDRILLLDAIVHGNSGTGPIDRRMDVNQDGAVTMDDFLIWQSLFIDWQQRRK
jgi:predicted extracellular nuclease